MAQMPCESSLRPDWLTRTFKSATARHQQQVWDLVQVHTEKISGGKDWEVINASRHFERCFKHECGVRFESAGMNAERNAGLSVVSFTGTYWALSSVYEQMALIEHLFKFKGGYHWTRLDAQITTLNPSQSAEQICTDVEEGRLWIKGYSGWEAQGLRDINGEVINGASACFGAPSSNKRATSYNKAAEQKWPIPARRDETRLRNDWADQHMTAIATAIAGAPSENAAIEAFQSQTAACVAQHMQYLDLTGQPKPRPKNWARNAKPPKWWSETLETKIEPVKLKRRLKNDVFERIAHMRMQWAPTWAEACAEMVVSGRSDSVEQASFDLAQQMLSALRPEHVQRVLEGLDSEHQEEMMEMLMAAADAAAVHAEVT